MSRSFHVNFANFAEFVVCLAVAVVFVTRDISNLFIFLHACISIEDMGTKTRLTVEVFGACRIYGNIFE